MLRTVQWWTIGLVGLLLMSVPLPISGQELATGSIEGTVKDASGGVLPGVTVDVSSPALVEKSRTTVTDAGGRYRFLRLPVGTYSLAFTLDGFSRVEQSGVIINAGFTATISPELEVGSLEETLTVVGASPVVDLRGTTSREVLTSEVIETIPSSRNVFDMSKFVIGASTSTPDVGGSTQHLYTAIQIHGSRGSDRAYYRDGVRVAAYFGSGDAPRAYGTTGAQEEVNYESSAIPASVPNGGMVINMVSKSGSNRLSGTVFSSGAFEGMESSNIDDDLRSRGVELTSGTKKVYDVDMAAGGPIKRDKVWLFGEARIFGITTLLANQRGLDGNQAENYNRRFEYFVKTTTQLNNENKLSVSFAYDGHIWPYRRESATFVTDEAAGYNTSGRDPYDRVIVANWTATRGNAWIFEVGFGYTRVGAETTWRPDSGPVGRLDIVRSTLTTSAIRVRSDDTNRQDYNVSATHVFDAGGSHQLQVGSNGDWGSFPETRDNKMDMALRYRDGVPDSADLYNTPVRADSVIRDFGFYAQDKWTIGNRLTLNVGVRYDYFRAFIPEQTSPAGTWVPERHFDKIPVITWQDVVPRIGVAYDLLGTGRTVLKGSFSRYMGVEAAGIAQQSNPNYYSTNRCTWRDLNGDDLATADEISQCQGWSGSASATRDPNLRRPYNNEYSLGVQHELARNLGLAVMYFRRENRDLRAFANTVVPTESYIPVQITNPLDNSPLTIYNQNPATRGQQQNLLSNSPKLNSTYNGIEVSVRRRFSADAYLSVGYHYGKNRGRTTSSGDLNDPNLDIFSEGAVGNDETQQFKLSGSYRLPWDIAMSGFVTVATGHPRARQLSVGRSLVPSLIRSSQTVRLEPNDASRYNTRKLVDLRFGRVFRIGDRRVEPFADLYNLFNVNTVLSEVTTYGPSLGRVSSTINPRIARIGVKVNF